MELISIVTGALPELGTIGVALVVLTVFRRQQQNDTQQLREQSAADREYFTKERQRIRDEAAADVERIRDWAEKVRTELMQELRDAKDEVRQVDREKDELLARLYPQDPATTALPRPSRHHAAAGWPEQPV